MEQQAHVEERDLGRLKDLGALVRRIPGSGHKNILVKRGERTDVWGHASPRFPAAVDVEAGTVLVALVVVG
jgi:hypothetical protein